MNERDMKNAIKQLQEKLSITENLLELLLAHYIHEIGETKAHHFLEFIDKNNIEVESLDQKIDRLSSPYIGVEARMMNVKKRLPILEKTSPKK